MRQRSAIFRCDASGRIGGGHVTRCLTLADALTKAGWACRFAVSAETPQTVPAVADYPLTTVSDQAGADLLVVDHYELDAHFETAARRWAKRIFVIDDLADRPHDCDFLLDQNLGRDVEAYRRLAPDCERLMIGPEYALLRPSFAELRKAALQRRDSGHVERVLISCGASDAEGHGRRIVSALLKHDIRFHIDLVLGTASVSSEPSIADDDERLTIHHYVKDMASQMAAADLGVGGAGVAAWERCVLGLPSVVIDDNRSANAKTLAALGAVRLAGDDRTFDPVHAADQVIGLANDRAGLVAMSQAAAAVVDGRGVERVLAVLNRTEKNRTA